MRDILEVTGLTSVLHVSSVDDPHITSRARRALSSFVSKIVDPLLYPEHPKHVARWLARCEPDDSRCRVRNTNKNEREIAGREYATSADFKRIFSEDVNNLYLLSLLLTGTPEKAEECFVEGIEQSTNGNYVFKEWARSWARRTIIQSAIRLIAPMDFGQTVSRSADFVRGMDKIPMLLHAEVRAILELAPLERFIFVMSVLERYSDNDCSILLGCARREVAGFRTRAMQQLGMFLSSRCASESSSDDSIMPKDIATITTPLIAQYFSLPGVGLHA